VDRRIQQLDKQKGALVTKRAFLSLWRETAQAALRQALRSFSTVVIGMMLNFSINTLSTAGVTNAGSDGPP
jgi:hypothetical protein